MSSDENAPHLQVVSRDAGDRITLALHGEVDLASAYVLERELHEAERRLPRRIVLDLAALDFLDTTGVHLINAALHRAEANAHELVLTRVPRCAGRLFALTGLEERLTVL